jgi:hypothetical protein
MGTVKIKNFSTYTDELAVFLVFLKMTGQRSAEAEKRGIYIKRRKGSDTYNVCEKDYK